MSLVILGFDFLEGYNFIYLIIIGASLIFIACTTVFILRYRRYRWLKRASQQKVYEMLRQRLEELDYFTEKTIFDVLDVSFPRVDLSHPKTQEIVSEAVKKCMDEMKEDKSFPNGQRLLDSLATAGRHYLLGHCKDGCDKVYNTIEKHLQHKGGGIFVVKSHKEYCQRSYGVVDEDETYTNRENDSTEYEELIEEELKLTPNGCCGWFCCIFRTSEVEVFRKVRDGFYTPLSSMFCSGRDVNDNEGELREGVVVEMNTNDGCTNMFSSLDGNEEDDTSIEQLLTKHNKGKFFNMSGCLARRMIAVHPAVKTCVSFINNNLISRQLEGIEDEGATLSRDETIVKISNHPDLLSTNHTRKLLRALFSMRRFGAETDLLIAPGVGTVTAAKVTPIISSIQGTFTPVGSFSSSLLRSGTWYDERNSNLFLTLMPPDDDKDYFSCNGKREDITIFYHNIQTTLLHADTFGNPKDFYYMYDAIEHFDIEVKKWYIRMNALVAAETVAAYKTMLRDQTTELREIEVAKVRERLATRASIGQQSLVAAPILKGNESIITASASGITSDEIARSVASDTTCSSLGNGLVSPEESVVRTSIIDLLTEKIDAVYEIFVDCRVSEPSSVLRYDGGASNLKDHVSSRVRAALHELLSTYNMSTIPAVVPSPNLQLHKRFTKSIPSTEEGMISFLNSGIERLPIKLMTSESFNKDVRRNIQNLRLRLLNMVFPSENNKGSVVSDNNAEVSEAVGGADKGDEYTLDTSQANNNNTTTSHNNKDINDRKGLSIVEQIAIVAVRDTIDFSEEIVASCAEDAENEIGIIIVQNYTPGGEALRSEWCDLVERTAHPVIDRVAKRLHCLHKATKTALRAIQLLVSHFSQKLSSENDTATESGAIILEKYYSREQLSDEYLQTVKLLGKTLRQLTKSIRFDNDKIRNDKKDNIDFDSKKKDTNSNAEGDDVTTERHDNIENDIDDYVDNDVPHNVRVGSDRGMDTVVLEKLLKGPLSLRRFAYCPDLVFVHNRLAEPLGVKTLPPTMFLKMYFTSGQKNSKNKRESKEAAEGSKS